MKFILFYIFIITKRCSFPLRNSITNTLFINVHYFTFVSRCYHDYFNQTLFINFQLLNPSKFQTSSITLRFKSIHHDKSNLIQEIHTHTYIHIYLANPKEGSVSRGIFPRIVTSTPDRISIVGIDIRDGGEETMVETRGLQVNYSPSWTRAIIRMPHGHSSFPSPLAFRIPRPPL